MNNAYVYGYVKSTLKYSIKLFTHSKYSEFIPANDQLTPTLKTGGEHNRQS